MALVGGIPPVKEMLLYVFQALPDRASSASKNPLLSLPGSGSEGAAEGLAVARRMAIEKPKRVANFRSPSYWIDTYALSGQLMVSNYILTEALELKRVKNHSDAAVDVKEWNRGCSARINGPGPCKRILVELVSQSKLGLPPNSIAPSVPLRTLEYASRTLPYLLD
ncbi:unnamed protein product [Sphagnum tenellum]